MKEKRLEILLYSLSTTCFMALVYFYGMPLKEAIEKTYDILVTEESVVVVTFMILTIAFLFSLRSTIRKERKIGAYFELAITSSFLIGFVALIIFDNRVEVMGWVQNWRGLIESFL